MVLESAGSTQDPRTKDIRCLPPEILSHIFVLGSQDDNVIFVGPEGEIPSVPFGTLCSHVCQDWRNISINTPQLWMCLDFEEQSPFHKSKEWIARSKGAPLLIDVNHDNPDEGLDDEARRLFIMDEVTKVAEIFNLIGPQAHRWLSLEVTSDVYDVIFVWQTLLRKCDPTPRLEGLALYCHEECIDQDTFYPQALRGPIPILPLGAPNLQTVVFWGVHIDWEAAAFLEGLENLHLAYHTNDVRPSVEQFVRVLARSPNLKTLSLESSAPLSGVWPFERIQLNDLQDLSIRDIDLEDASAIVNHLEFPTLVRDNSASSTTIHWAQQTEQRSLSLDLESDDTGSFVDAICKGSRPRFQDVDCLKLLSFQCQPEAGKRFLHSMPNIVSLCLNFNFAPRHFLDGLIDTQPNPLCPKLTTLKLSGVDDEALKKLVIARKATATPIERLDLDSDDDLDHDLIRWLKEQVGELSFYEGSDDETDEDETDEDEDD